MTGTDRRIQERSPPVRHVIVAQAIKDGRAPAELGGWPGRLLDALLDSRRRAGTRAASALLVLLTAVAVLASCSGHGGEQARPTAPSRPVPVRRSLPVPAKVIVRPATIGAVGDVPAGKVRAALDTTVSLVLTQYADRLVLTGKDAGLRSQLHSSDIAQALEDRPRDRSLLAIRPVFPASVLRLGDPVAQVVRSRFTVRSRRCDFSKFCATGSRPSGLNVHWSGALRYQLTRVGNGEPAEVAYVVEIDWAYLVQRFPANPVFVAASPELGTVQIRAGPVLASCQTKGYLVPPPDAKAPTKADFAPPEAESAAKGAPGPCPL